MARSPHFNFSVLIISLIVTGMLIGCKRDPTLARTKELNKSPLLQLCNCYNLFQARNGYRGPTGKEEFVAFLASGGVDRNLERMGIDLTGINDLFVSPRDGQPYRVKYGVSGSPFGSDEPVVFETEGLDGKVLVGFTKPRQEEFDLANSNTLFSTKTKITLTRTREDAGP